MSIIRQPTFIKEIVLNGFKSFGESVSIKLGKGFNVIVGPSGSGKSNIIDGLRFALGRSAIRAGGFETWRDLINAGTRTREAATSAEVTVVLDNSQDSFPLYTGGDVTIWRQIMERGTCIYRLNQTRHTREEMRAILASANINPDGFYVVPQGKASELAYISPEGRRAFIEDLVGMQDPEPDWIERTRLFMGAFNEINSRFSEMFAKLSPGGIAKMILENPARPLEGGVVIEARLRGKSIRSVEAFSGGEKALIAAAFIFAVGQYLHSPFHVLDDIDGELVPPEVHRVSMAIKELSSTSQFIVISHREECIVNADKIYGVSMKDSTSSVFYMKLD